MNNANIINLNNVTDVDKWLQEEQNVYVGRPSKWGNPFKISSKNSRQDVVELFRQFIPLNKNRVESVGQLKGKVLGCWCAPNLCHAEVLHQLAGNHPCYQSTSTEMSQKMESSSGSVSSGSTSIKQESCLSTILGPTQWRGTW